MAAHLPPWSRRAATITARGSLLVAVIWLLVVGTHAGPQPPPRRQPFSDDPIQPRATRLRRVQPTDLRTRVDALRQLFGLAPYSRAASATQIQSLSLAELRTAVSQAYAKFGSTPPTFEAPIETGTTALDAALAKLRQAVEDLEAGLRVEGDHFVLNGTPKFLLFISYFDAMHRANPDNSASVDTDFAYLKSIGIDGIRMFPNWHGPYQCPTAGRDDKTVLTQTGNIDEAMWRRFTFILDRAVKNGLVVDVSFANETIATNPTPITFDNYKRGIGLVAARLASNPTQPAANRHILIDVQNEYGNNGLSAAQVEQIKEHVRSVDANRVVTASQGVPHDTGLFAATRGMDVAAYHGDRNISGFCVPQRPAPWPWYCEETVQGELNQLRSGLGTPDKPKYFQEPMPFRAFPGCSPQTEDPNANHARLAAKWAKKHGAAAWTFHTRQSFDLANNALLDILSGVGPKGEPNADQKRELEALKDSVDRVTWGAIVERPRRPK